jgi:hypothetical protein
MKIFILNVPALLQPQSQTLKYPAHNKDYGVEQDFEKWIKKQKNMLVDNPADADWHYLPIYWTRWHINHNFAANNQGLTELQQEIDKVLLDDNKTFTITQFDGGTLINAGNTIVFTGARTANEGIDIPILCSPHKKPPLPVKKKYLASFNGAFSTHTIREEMAAKFKGDPDILIGDGGVPTRFYKRWFWAKNYNLNIMTSYMALCPRGTSHNSYRFFEAMQLGVAPCLIGDKDVRPFKNFIPWDEISWYASSINELVNMLKTLDKNEALKKGQKAYKYWKNELFYQKWCKYVIMELEQLG